MNVPRTLISTLAILVVAAVLTSSCRDKIFSNDPCPQGVKITQKLPVIVRQMTHLTSSYTQGLLYHDGLIYESTGGWGKSKLYALDPQTNCSVVKNVSVPYISGGNVFAEGLAYKDNHLVQLTWLRQRTFIYTVPDLTWRADSVFTYKGQGWGLTTDGTSYIMSNGSDTLYYRDDVFEVTKKLAVTWDEDPLQNLNELEYVKDRIYANVYGSTKIFMIHPKTGCVTATIDCMLLVSIANRTNPEEVLNGIAYNDETGNFYVTGKNWPIMFEVVFKDK
jgi:glutamine cyclotransferase